MVKSIYRIYYVYRHVTLERATISKRKIPICSFILAIVLNLPALQFEIKTTISSSLILIRWNFICFSKYINI